MAEKTAKTPEPMDAGAPEVLIGTPQETRKRVAYALTTLVNEASALFPETTHEFSGFNGRGVALEVTFELASLSTDDQVLLSELLLLVKDDERVREVTRDAREALVHVALHSSARLQDIRDTFNLDDAFSILVDGEPDDTEIGMLSAMVGDYQEDAEYMSVYGSDEPIYNLAGESL